MRAIATFLFLLTLSLTAVAKPLDLSVKLATDRSIYSIGQPVAITLEATNQGSSTADLLFGSGQSFDIFITDIHNKEVWRWARGMVFTMAVRNVSLAPGKSLSYTAVWQPVKPGKYFLHGRLTSASPLDSPRKTVIITPPSP